MSILRTVLLSSLLLFSSSFLPGNDAQACTSRGSGVIIIIDYGNGTAWIIIARNSFAIPTSVMFVCNVGLRFDPAVVASVDEVQIINPFTNEMTPGLSFSEDKNAAAKFEKMAPAEGTMWSAFTGIPNASFPDGDDTELHIAVTMAPGATSDDIAAMFKRNGLFVNGASDVTGRMDFRHMGLEDGEGARIYHHPIGIK